MISRCCFALLMLTLLGCSGKPGPAEELHIPAAEPTGRTIVVFGASGRIGGLVVVEALGRGHSVIGVSRNPRKLTINHELFSAVRGDVTDVESFREITTGTDAVILSVQGSGKDNSPENTVQARAAETAVVAFTGMENAPYVLQIGGATTMFETKEAMLENLYFPAEEGSEAYARVFGHLVALQIFRQSNIDWTVLTPPFEINGWSKHGITNVARTGSYRTSTTGLITDENGELAEILATDLAVAAVDEIEDRKFVRRRFTAAN